MFYVDKKASGEHLTHCSKIMDRIVAENPSYWPYGCNPEMFNGGVYLIRKSASHEPVGFTGWQEFDEDGKKVGYYSIGILPEYRQQGFAKEAVAKLINEKSATVDEVRAFVMQHNKPSLELAKTLNVNTLIKSAGTLTAKEILGRLAGGLAAAGGTDYMVHGGDYSSFSPSRIGNAVLNTILGASGTHLMASPKAENFMKGLATLGLLPTKDLAFSAVAAMPKVEELINKKLQEQPAVPTPAVSDKDKTILAGLLGAGALGLTGAGFGIAGALNKAQEKRDAGRIQLRLPTRDKNDQETVVDVPLDQANLPPALVSKVMRDTRRKLREETKARTWRRDGRNRLLTNAEPYDDQYEDDEDKLEKAAFAYYRTKLATGNSSSIKPFSIVNTMATPPDQQKMDLEKQKLEMQSKQNESNPAGDSAAPDNSQVLSDLEKSQKELKEANDNLQKQMSAMQHTSELNREALKTISNRTSAIANNLKIAGLLKIAAPNQETIQKAQQQLNDPVSYPSYGDPNLMRHNYEQFKNKSGPGGVLGRWLYQTPEQEQQIFDQAWNKTYKKDPRLLGDYLSNVGAYAQHGAGKLFQGLTSGLRTGIRMTSHGMDQIQNAIQTPRQTGETWYNPSLSRIKNIAQGAAYAVGGPALGAVTTVMPGGTFLKTLPALGLSIGAGFLDPYDREGYLGAAPQAPAQPQTPAAPAAPDQTELSRNEQMRRRLAQERDPINYINSLAPYAFAPNTPQQSFYESLGLDRQPLTLAQQGLLSLAGSGGGSARGILSGLTGGLMFNDQPRRAPQGLTRDDVENMRTPLQEMQ